MEATGLFVPRFHKNQGAQNSAKDIHEERIEMYCLLLKNGEFCNQTVEDMSCQGSG